MILTSVPARPITERQLPSTRPHRLDRKVSPEVAVQLAADYESGVPSTHLTMTYGLGKGSVLKLFREAGVKMRSQGLSDDKPEEAATLYRDGWFLARVARRFDCSADSVRRALKTNGVQIRPRKGWE